MFHAEQFDALRRSCQCEQSIIESLARCMKWEATGGKSGSAFLKTRGKFRDSVPIRTSKLLSVRQPFHCEGAHSERVRRHVEIRPEIFRIHVYGHIFKGEIANLLCCCESPHHRDPAAYRARKDIRILQDCVQECRYGQNRTDDALGDGKSFP